MAKKPWEMTDEEFRAESERSREELLAADRIAAPLFVQQMAEADSDELGELLEPIAKASDESARRQHALLVGSRPKRRTGKK